LPFSLALARIRDMASLLITGKKFQAELLDGPLVRISGQLREDFSAKELRDALAPALKAYLGKPVAFDLGRVTVMNSVGINQWIQFVTAFEKSHGLHFVVLSDVFIEMGFMIPNVLGKPQNTVGQIKLPYRCPSCKSVLSQAFECSRLKDAAGNFVVPRVPCPSCSTPMGFDAIEDEYQGFLKRRTS
jgi:hypothetical protein